MQILKVFVIACGVTVLLALPVGGQDVRAALLERASNYVADLENHLTAVVAEETYAQQTGGLQRRLRSDLLLVRVDGDARYVEFRDVFEVDGSAVRDRDERLTRLFVDSSGSDSDGLRAIVAESARYNLGNVQRTINMPTLALVFLRRENQGAVSFAVQDKGTPMLSRFNMSGAPDFPAFPRGTVILTFRERPRRTLIRGAGSKDIPSHGRFWIDPETGGVLMSELVAEDSLITATIDVRYARDHDLDSMVPVEMRERYGTFGRQGIEGWATYARFRTFQVQTSTDDVKPVK